MLSVILEPDIGDSEASKTWSTLKVLWVNEKPYEELLHRSRAIPR